jgi:hypothetical protein
MFGFHKMRGISQIAAQALASEGIRYMEEVSLITYELAIQQLLMDISRAVCIYISQPSEFNWPFVVKRLPVNYLTELS